MDGFLFCAFCGAEILKGIAIDLETVKTFSVRPPMQDDIFFFI